MNDSPEHRMAIHEAGHALVGCLLGADIRLATVDSEVVQEYNSESAGGVLLHRRPDTETSLAITFAGSEAERLMYGESKDAGMGDATRAADMTYDYNEMQQAAQRARRILKDNRTDLEQLAERLIDHRTLEAHEIEQILRD